MMRWTLVAMIALVCATGCPRFHSGPVSGTPPQGTFVDLDGLRVRYVEKGTGPPVVLLHGFATAIEAWSLVIPRLAPHHRVVALDLKGFGWTSRPAGDYSPAAQAEIVFALLDYLEISEASIVAHSWGASVALAMALARPARVDRLVLYSAWVFEDQQSSFALWARRSGIGEVLYGLFYEQRQEDRLYLAYHDPRYVTEELVELFAHALQRPGTAAAALAVVRGQRYRAVERRYSAIQHETLVIWGGRDAITPVHFGRRLASEMPRARLVVYPDCGHIPMIEAVNPSTRDVLQFLVPSRRGTDHSAAHGEHGTVATVGEQNVGT